MNFKKAPNIFAIKIKEYLITNCYCTTEYLISDTQKRNTWVTPNRSQYFPNFKYIKNNRDHCLNKFYKNICCTYNIFTLTVASSDCVSVIQNSKQTLLFTIPSTTALVRTKLYHSALTPNSNVLHIVQKWIKELHCSTGSIKLSNLRSKVISTECYILACVIMK